MGGKNFALAFQNLREGITKDNVEGEIEMINPKQQSFCIEYQRTGNATQSYKKVYGVADDTTAQAAASRLLADDRVQKYLQELSAQTRTESVADRQELQETATKILRGEIKSVTVDRNGDLIELPTALKDRLKAIELLAKLQGLFVSKQELEITNTPPIVIKDNI